MQPPCILCTIVVVIVLTKFVFKFVVMHARNSLPLIMLLVSEMTWKADFTNFEVHLSMLFIVSELGTFSSVAYNIAFFSSFFFKSGQHKITHSL